METLLFASQNENKVREVSALLKGTFEIKSLHDVGFAGELDEPYDSFIENAKIKAKQGYDYFKLPCFAEDAGLVVEALDGRPGVKSARYAGLHKKSSDNTQKVLADLHGKENRIGYFIAVIAYFDGMNYRVFEGKVYGHITNVATGTNGFGYDPIFVPLGYDQSFGELGNDIKYKISHRTKAMNQFVDYLKRQF